MRLSSNPLENSLICLEKRMRENIYAHHIFEPSLCNPKAVEYIKYLSNESPPQVRASAENFLRHLDPNNPEKIESKYLKFDFASLRDKMFVEESRKYRNKSILKTLQNSIEDEAFQRATQRQIAGENEKVQTGGLTLEGEDHKVQLLKRINKVTDNFIKIKYHNKKSKQPQSIGKWYH